MCTLDKDLSAGELKIVLDTNLPVNNKIPKLNQPPKKAELLHEELSKPENPVKSGNFQDICLNSKPSEPLVNKKKSPELKPKPDQVKTPAISCQKFFSSPAPITSMPSRTASILESLNNSPVLAKKYPKRQRDEFPDIVLKPPKAGNELTPKRQKGLVYDLTNQENEENQLNQAASLRPTLKHWNRSNSLTMSSNGFSNLGNTCYMNAILQCLLNIRIFKNDLLANYQYFKEACGCDQETVSDLEEASLLVKFKKNKLCLY